jgi:hypothetical protein
MISLSSWQEQATAVAEALFDAPEARIAWLVDDVDHFLATVKGRSRLVFLAGLRAITTLGPPSLGTLRPFARLSLEDRRRALAKLEHGPVGMAIFAVKTLLCLHYYEHPDAAREAGLPTKSPRRSK